MCLLLCTGPENCEAEGGGGGSGQGTRAAVEGGRGGGGAGACCVVISVDLCYVLFGTLWGQIEHASPGHFQWNYTQALGEAQGSASGMAALLRGQLPFSSSSSLRWMTEAMQNYLARPTAFK